MIRAATGRADQCAPRTAGTPNGAVSTSATNCARQITGSAPLRCCSGPARLTAKPYEISAATINAMPKA